MSEDLNQSNADGNTEKGAEVAKQLLEQNGEQTPAPEDPPDPSPHTEAEQSQKLAAARTAVAEATKNPAWQDRGRIADPARAEAVARATYQAQNKLNDIAPKSRWQQFSQAFEWAYSPSRYLLRLRTRAKLKFQQHDDTKQANREYDQQTGTKESFVLDPGKARAMAEAENVYRDRADKARSEIPTGRDSLRDPGKVIRKTISDIGNRLVGRDAARLAGLRYEGKASWRERIVPENKTPQDK